MPYKFIIKNFITGERNTYYLESLPEEQVLLEDLFNLGIVENKDSFTKTQWYSKLISGLIVLDKNNLNSSLNLIDIESIPQSIKDEYYIFAVNCEIKIPGLNSYFLRTTVLSQNKHLNFYSVDPNYIINDFDIIYTGNIKDVDLFNSYALICDQHLDKDINEWEINENF